VVSRQWHRTNCTLIFSAGQAILAAKAGANYVSPFIGRIDDGGWDGMEPIGQIHHIYCAGLQIRNPRGFDPQSAAHHKGCWKWAHVCSPLESIMGLSASTHGYRAGEVPGRREKKWS
jgi:transaldolase